MNENGKKVVFRAGFVAIVGKPNVGKSTLLNRLLGQKLAIVSSKPQTTRHRIPGILNGNRYQIIFLDTPGFLEPKYLLQKTLLQTIQKSLSDTDLILMMIDASDISRKDDQVIQLLKSFQVPKLLIINKIDLIPKDSLLPLIDSFRLKETFQEIIPVSAMQNDGLDLLLSLVLKYIPEGNPFYPTDTVACQPERFFVSEIIREQIFNHFVDEIPYATAVHVEEFTEHAGRKDVISAIIIVERDSQKGILIGKRGQSIKKIGQMARENIEAFLGRPVFLEIKVCVQKDWRYDLRALKQLGYT